MLLGTTVLIDLVYAIADEQREISQDNLDRQCTYATRPIIRIDPRDFQDRQRR